MGAIGSAERVYHMEEVGAPIYIDGRHCDAMGSMKKDIDFYQRCIERYGDPTLELGCGTGRITIPLAEKGIDITGVDIFDPMLKRAKEKASKKDIELRLIKGDMRAFSLSRTFNTILLPANPIPLNAMQVFIELEDYESLFSKVYGHLDEDGRFIFEIFHPDFETLTAPSDEEIEIVEYADPYGDGDVRITQKVDYDPASQILNLDWYYYLNERLEAVRDWELRMIFPKEIEILLNYNGFEVEERYMGPEDSETSKGPPTEMIIAKKR